MRAICGSDAERTPDLVHAAAVLGEYPTGQVLAISALSSVAGAAAVRGLAQVQLRPGLARRTLGRCGQRPAATRLFRNWPRPRLPPPSSPSSSPPPRHARPP